MSTQTKAPGAGAKLPVLPAGPTYRSFRKRVHLVCVLIFIALPFFNVIRFDIPRQRFYFAGFELWISEFAVIFFSLMFCMFLIVAMALIYGRMYCGYLCPQMIFSEASHALETKITKYVNKYFIQWPLPRRKLASRIAFSTLLGLASVFLAFVFTSYFVEPRDLLQRLAKLDIQTAGGITGAVVTLIAFLDFAFVRQKFCVTVCPYGYLQGMMVDKNTLLVMYRDEKKECIECKKCVRVCEMDIDIRKSPYQIECIHCGECIDACADVLRRLGKQTLIHYAWGEKGELTGNKAEPWYMRLGFRDAKRFVILAVLLFYAAGLITALSMRRPVLIAIVPDRTTLFRKLEDGQVTNKFRLKLANRSSQPAIVELRAEDLPSARLMLETPVRLAPGESVERSFEIAVTPWPGASEVNPFRLVARSSLEKEPEVYPNNFLLPVKNP